MVSKIEELIDDIERFIDNCKFMTLSQSKIIVNKDEIDGYLRELRQATPDEIKRYQKMLNQKNEILADARAKAEALIQEATVTTTQLVNEHEIMQQAYAKANEIVTMATNQAQEILDNATIEANSVRTAAMQYTDDLLANLEKIITHTTSLAEANYAELIGNLNSCNGIVKNNRRELNPTDDEIDSTVVLADEVSQNTGSLELL